VRQRASQISGDGSESEARSTFTVTNLRLSLPLLPQRLSASLGIQPLRPGFPLPQHRSQRRPPRGPVLPGAP
jgi:hypothetical protein